MVKKKKTGKKPVKKKKAAAKKPPVKSAKKGKRKPGPAKVYLGLGSNVGDREEYIEQAIFLLEKNPDIQVIKRSSNYETEPEGGTEQPPFINSAVAIITKLPPEKLLEVCQEIETALGRDREMEWGPRTIDIDILLFEDQIISEDKLQIPHPLMHERMFVLKPLKEIAPHAIHPVLEKSIEDLYEERKAEVGEKYDDELPGFKEISKSGGSGSYDDYERW
ncbi:MAG: 2-amino-4-hydroxy-6-hydroxymethyldihydropteridine diphosphokinase [Candidatus Margulisbacteria bacterium]|nr:2-amino-4-hydroxy-6-hydroxymethyldihydropteridine diphosphokinase [Candidatus Margulisiibacteriota bacterium]